MDKYQNREEAGKILAEHLQAYAGRDDVIVLALPRGGVPVAFQVAGRLRAPLDVFIVRKLGVPGHPELAMGAIAMGDIVFFNEDIIQSLHISKDEIDAVIAIEKAELNRRQMKYRKTLAQPVIENKIVILVDDGIATGATIRAAILALQQLNPAKIIVAIPVADKTLVKELANSVDEIICPLQPEYLYAVGIWYENFMQTEDAEVELLLDKAKQL